MSRFNQISTIQLLYHHPCSEIIFLLVEESLWCATVDPENHPTNKAGGSTSNMWKAWIYP